MPIADKPTTLRDLTDQIQREENDLRRGGDPAGHERQRRHGRLPVRQRLERLLDHDAPFLELNLWAAWRMYSEAGDIPAAVRLGLIGTYEAQELQTILSRDIDVVIATCGRLQPIEIAQTAPLIDLCQSTHDRLYSRLFQS